MLPGSFNPLHAGHVRLAAVAARRLGGPVHFELSAANVDKPDLPAAEVERRVGQFAGVGPVWVTRAATFVEKARLLPGVGFVVGFDTAVRVIDPRYYGDAAARDAALRELADLGARFLVGGRLCGDGAFRQWAGDHPHLFEVIPEAEFRVDLSSTQLRAAPTVGQDSGLSRVGTGRSPVPPTPDAPGPARVDALPPPG